MASSLYLNETVPNEHSTSFGFTTNFGVICGVMVCLLMGAVLPDPVTHPQNAKDDNFWIVINLFPALIGLINMILWLFVFKFESIKACLSSKEGTKYFEQGKLHVSRLYCEDDYHSIHKELLNGHLEANKDQVKAPSFCEVLSDPRYNRATWLVCSIAFFNQMSGVNLISIYSTTLF